jgi:RND family efflux transporter MFP subunit
VKEKNMRISRNSLAEMSMRIAVPFAFLVICAGCVDRNSQQLAQKTAKLDSDRSVAVTATTAVERSFEENLELTGALTVDAQVDIAPEASGRLAEILVKEGQSVVPGQLLAVLDVQALRAQEVQAKAQIAVTDAQIALAEETARLTPERTRAQARAAAEEIVAAEADLERLRRGPHPEEIRQAESDVEAARANFDNARRQFERREVLGREGVVPLADVDRARAERDAMAAQLRRAEQALTLLKKGTRAEEVAAGAARLRQARENARAAQASVQIDGALRSETQVARANRRSALAQLEQARDALNRTVVRAPVKGVVYGRPPAAGSFALAGTALFRLVGGESAFFEADLSQQDLVKIKPGQPAVVSLEGVIPTSAIGKVASISPIGEKAGRLFRVRVSVPRLVEWRPGMYGRAVVTLRRSRGVGVPVESVQISDGTARVALIESGRLRWVPVKHDALDGEIVRVTGVPVGASVAVRGQNGLGDGTQVELQEGSR